MPPRQPIGEKALHDALNESRRSLALVVFLFIASTCGLASMVYVYESGQLIREDRLVAEARKHLLEHADEIFLEAGDLVSDTLPPVGDALVDQLQKDLPAYVQAVDSQSEILIDQLAESLRKKVRLKWREYLARHRKVLREEFPKITSEDTIARLEADFERVHDRLMERYYVGEFRAELQRFASAWRAIPPAPRQPGTPGATRRLMDDLEVWVEMEFTMDLESTSGKLEKGGSKDGK